MAFTESERGVTPLRCVVDFALRCQAAQLNGEKP